MMSCAHVTWLMVIQVLLTQQNHQVLCRTTFSPPTGKNALRAELHEDPAPDYSQVPSDVGPQEKSDPPPVMMHLERRQQRARLMTSVLGAKLQEVEGHLHVGTNVSCEEILSASAVDDPLDSRFPQEVLALSLVPVLLVAGCPVEAQVLVLKLYQLMGEGDTEELLMQLEVLMERRANKSKSSSSRRADGASRHMEALMFNIHQLALPEDGPTEQQNHCEGWSRVNGTVLLGRRVDGSSGRLEDALSSCDSVGVRCAGVTRTSPLAPGLYQAVLKKGSRILPSASSTASDTWIRRCGDASGGRIKRSSPSSCINRSEERVYSVVEWIPAVSTLYNLGTAVYYASVNCTHTAKERAILSVVDLGTDALMVATGGTAGVAGYAVGAGLKTGVKAGVRYLLDSMKEEDDLLVNQLSREDAIFTVQ